MTLRILLIVALSLASRGAAAAADADRGPATKTVIAASVAERLGGSAHLEVEILQAPGVVAEPVSASVMPGARFGSPARFLVTLADGRRTAVVARVQAVAAHAIAARSLERDAEFAAADVDWTESSLDGQLVAALPTAADILGARARRAVVRGEVLTSAVLKAPEAIRAGDPVTILIRRGAVEVRGEGRAVSSGAVGDDIRVLRPGSRQPLAGRIVEPAVVEISR